jgi:hypothetical protein
MTENNEIRFSKTNEHQEPVVRFEHIFMKHVMGDPAKNAWNSLTGRDGTVMVSLNASSQAINGRYGAPEDVYQT